MLTADHKICKLLSLKLFLELFDKAVDSLLIASVISPLSRSAGLQQACFLQFDEITRNHRLGQPRFRGNGTDANAALEIAGCRHVLLGCEMLLRMLQPFQNVEPGFV